MFLWNILFLNKQHKPKPVTEKKSGVSQSSEICRLALWSHKTAVWAFTAKWALFYCRRKRYATDMFP